MFIEEWQAKKLYINKAQLEKVIGITLNEVPAKLFDYQEPLEDYLIPYMSMPFFDKYTAIYLLQGLNPEKYNCSKNGNFYPIHKALLTAIKNKELGSSTYTENEYSEEDLNIEHLALEKWAIFHGYKWKLPPYRSFTAKDNRTTTNDTTALKAEIDRLKQENAELLKALQQADKAPESAVDYQAFSIHGHTSENLEILFKIAKVIAEKCDPDNPHSYPLKSDYSEYVKRYYSDSEKLIEALFQILTPNKVKHKGRPPKGVDTFQGFIDKP